MKQANYALLGGLPATQIELALIQKAYTEAICGIAKALQKNNVPYTILSGGVFTAANGFASITQGWVLWKNGDLVRLEAVSNIPYQSGTTLYLNYSEYYNPVVNGLVFKDGNTHDIHKDCVLKLSLTNSGNTSTFEVFDNLNRFETLLGGGGVPVGSVQMWVSNTIPVGWRVCNGEILNHVQNPEYLPLFTILGYAFGNGNGNTGEFNLPNLGGCFPLGANQDYPLNQKGGAKEAILEIANLPPHDHQIEPEAHKHTYKFPKIKYVADNIGSGTPAADPDPAIANDTYTSNDSANVPQLTGVGYGTSQPFSVLNPYFAINFIIKVY